MLTRFTLRMPVVVSFALTVLAPLVACSSSARDGSHVSPEYFASPDPALKDFPFSEAVRAGALLFVSGQIGALPGASGLVPGGVGAESKQAIENIKAVLQRHGSSLDQVVKCSVFLADMGEWAAFNAVYRQYFPSHFPARSALGANGLALGARVELECTAFVPPIPK